MPGSANALEPGKRPRSTLQSTLATKDGLAVTALGSPGGDDQCLRTMLDPETGVLSAGADPRVNAYALAW